MTHDVGDIWMWKGNVVYTDEYWLILQMPDTGLCLSGTHSGIVDEITILQEPHKWEKVA